MQQKHGENRLLILLKYYEHNRKKHKTMLGASKLCMLSAKTTINHCGGSLEAENQLLDLLRVILLNHCWTVTWGTLGTVDLSPQFIFYSIFKRHQHKWFIYIKYVCKRTMLSWMKHFYTNSTVYMNTVEIYNR